jgi:hypothetical protein
VEPVDCEAAMKFMDVSDPGVEWRLEVEPLLRKADIYLADAIAAMPTSIEKVKAAKALVELRSSRQQLRGNLLRAENGERLR